MVNGVLVVRDYSTSPLADFSSTEAFAQALAAENHVFVVMQYPRTRLSFQESEEFLWFSTTRSSTSARLRRVPQTPCPSRACVRQIEVDIPRDQSGRQTSGEEGSQSNQKAAVTVQPPADERALCVLLASTHSYRRLSELLCQTN